MKVLKIVLIAIGILTGLIMIAALVGWLWLKSLFIDFETDFSEKRDLTQLTIDGYTFWDRNGNGELDIYEDEREPLEKRVSDLLSQMTIEEKIHLLKGSGLASAMGMGDPVTGVAGAVGTIVPTPRLGIPTVYLSDGPAGLRIEPEREGEDRTYYCTAFPIATLLSSTWNTDLVNKVGTAMGKEAREYGIDVILGPGANIHRHPLCGRNFEYYSEDPVLTGLIGAAMVNGIESNGVGASVKHFVANNQETNRFLNNSMVSERALREIYLKGFEIIVRNSQPWTIMSSYNKVNGTYVAESPEILTNILRDEWGFEGLVMSDWFGGNDPVAMVKAGNDLLEPGTKKQWEALIAGYEDGTLSEKSINLAVSRILRLILTSHQMKNEEPNNNPDLEAHAQITRQSASEGMILLKNDETLPITSNLNVALLGSTSYDFIAGGTGSGDVNEAYTISLEEGLRNAGFAVNDFAKSVFEEHKEANKEEFVKPEGINAMLNPYTPPEIKYTEQQLDQIESSSDIAIITIGRNAGEGGDRVVEDDFLLADIEQEMLETVCQKFQAAGKKVIVVLNIGGVIETASWKSQPDAILLAWQGGQEGGNSVADILSGRVNPSGKLPMTFPVSINDHWSHANFPLTGESMSLLDLLGSRKEKAEDEKVENVDITNYEEGVYVGYRHFDKSGKDVSYPFGYGLSYTDFIYSDLEIKQDSGQIILSLKVENSGKSAGKEVVQVYVAKTNSTVDRPVQELKAFYKTELLAPGNQEEINLQLSNMDLMYWSEEKSDWELEPGLYEIRIGTSSRDIRLKEEINIKVGNWIVLPPASYRDKTKAG